MKFKGQIFDLGGARVTGIGAPTAPTDAVNLAYFYQWLGSRRVRVGTTQNISLTGAQTIDSVALSVGNRVLVKNQTDATQNGVYIVGSGAWTRAGDFDESSEIVPGAAVIITEGGASADTMWAVSSDSAVTVGTTAISFSQIGSSNPGSSYTFGTGLTQSGANVTIDTGVVTRKYSTTIGDGATTTFTVNHALSTRDVVVSVYDAATYEEALVDVTHATASTVSIAFASAPSANAYRVVVHG